MIRKRWDEKKAFLFDMSRLYQDDIWMSNKKPHRDLFLDRGNVGRFAFQGWELPRMARGLQQVLSLVLWLLAAFYGLAHHLHLPQLAAAVAVDRAG